MIVEGYWSLLVSSKVGTSPSDLSTFCSFLRLSILKEAG